MDHCATPYPISPHPSNSFYQPALVSAPSQRISEKEKLRHSTLEFELPPDYTGEIREEREEQEEDDPVKPEEQEVEKKEKKENEEENKEKAKNCESFISDRFNDVSKMHIQRALWVGGKEDHMKKILSADNSADELADELVRAWMWISNEKKKEGGGLG